MTEILTIVQALNKVMKDVGAVRKQEQNQQQRFNFRGIDTVTKAVYPALVKHGVVVVPSLVEKSMEESRTKSGAVMHNVYITMDYTFYGPAGDQITARVAAESFDSGDKATAKAMSVALRTALLQSLMLPTDEVDPDAESYERAPQDDRATMQDDRATIDKLVSQAVAMMGKLGYDADQQAQMAMWASSKGSADLSAYTLADARKLHAGVQQKTQAVKE